ncbi:partner of Y14 and mago-like isoform X2 [Limulus polyphemus]|uniref:Partner of Y14 and mago-like isoform X2 n=1 Tax=Limulus polyphemus TaxID=6850 RepID=A0ABM1TMX6_LIMPO|nr:partner of Y14 and mago-like isoform X2 [Limulus polyphemus]
MSQMKAVHTSQLHREQMAHGVSQGELKKVMFHRMKFLWLHLEEVVKVQQGQSGSIPGLTEMLPPTTTKSTKKKKKKKHQQQCNTSDQNLAKDVTNLHISETGWDKNNETSENKASGDPVKRIKNLKKKLRDIEKLEQKIESGELLKPEKDQLEKISRKGEIEAEIEDLELDLELQDD